MNEESRGKAGGRGKGGANIAAQRQPMTEETVARVAQATIKILDARGGYDPDELMRFIVEFYRRTEADRMTFIEPVPLSAKWVHRVAEVMAVGFETWLRNEAGELQ